MGRPKAWLPIGGEVMLQRVVRILQQVVEPVVVVAAPEQELPPLPAAAVITRDPVEAQGPLRGLATGLAALHESPCPGVYLSACDVPFLRPAFVRRIVESLQDAEACVPRVGGFFHPLAAAYRTHLRSVAEHLLAVGRSRPWDLIQSVRHRFLDADDLHDVDPDLRSLRNVNTPAEYEEILRDLTVEDTSHRT